MGQDVTHLKGGTNIQHFTYDKIADCCSVFRQS